MDIRTPLHFVVTSLAVFLANHQSFAGIFPTSEDAVIYGTDNRMNRVDVQNPMQLKLADSTLALIRDSHFIPNANGTQQLLARTFGEARNLCAQERFRSEPTAAFCSGSLIGKDLILTAGHCVRDLESCASTKFVFGYAMKNGNRAPDTIENREIYGCKKIIHTQISNGVSTSPYDPPIFDRIDYAIVQLDREVVGHEPLKFSERKMGDRLEVGTRLLLIGHPTGLPTKIEDGGKVRSTSSPGFFVATTDSYGGNSGSAVFNYLTGEIEGILTYGETDFEEVMGPTFLSPSCYISKVCKENECRGEDVTEITYIKDKLAHPDPAPAINPSPAVRPARPPFIAYQN